MTVTVFRSLRLHLSSKKRIYEDLREHLKKKEILGDTYEAGLTAVAVAVAFAAANSAVALVAKFNLSLSLNLRLSNFPSRITGLQYHGPGLYLRAKLHHTCLISATNRAMLPLLLQMMMLL